MGNEVRGSWPLVSRVLDGLWKNHDMLHPRPIPIFGSCPGSTPIRFVAVGVSHALFISVFGEVYAVGRTELGKLGLGVSAGSEGHVMTPEKVVFSQQPGPMIVAAAAGARHSLLLASSGEVWGCGLARSGELPTNADLGVERISWVPELLDRLPCFCTSLAAGICLSFFVGECGEVYLTGTARQTDQPFSRPLHFDPAMPYRIPGLRQIEQASVSIKLSFFQWEHALFARQDGSLYAWGHASHGEFDCNASCPCQGSRWRRSLCPPGFHNQAVPFFCWAS